MGKAPDEREDYGARIGARQETAIRNDRAAVPDAYGKRPYPVLHVGFVVAQLVGQKDEGYQEADGNRRQYGSPRECSRDGEVGPADHDDAHDKKDEADGQPPPLVVERLARVEEAADPADKAIEQDRPPRTPCQEQPSQSRECEESKPDEEDQHLQELAVIVREPQPGDLVVDPFLAELEEIVDEVHSGLQGEPCQDHGNGVDRVAAAVVVGEHDAQRAGKSGDHQRWHPQSFEPCPP